MSFSFFSLLHLSNPFSFSTQDVLVSFRCYQEKLKEFMKTKSVLVSFRCYIEKQKQRKLHKCFSFFSLLRNTMKDKMVLFTLVLVSFRCYKFKIQKSKTPIISFSFFSLLQFSGASSYIHKKCFSFFSLLLLPRQYRI